MTKCTKSKFSFTSDDAVKKIVYSFPIGYVYKCSVLNSQ